MPIELPQNNPEKKEIVDDNARKFLVDALAPTFLEDHEASSYSLATDWLETGEDNEKKVVYKQFKNGDTQILLISKTTTDGGRTSEKEKITEDKYKELLGSSVLHLEKKRHEFTYAQGGIPFSAKYDEFAGGKLYMLEIDATNEEERGSFNPRNFPTELTEVTGDTQYYGYRVAGALEALDQRIW